MLPYIGPYIKKLRIEGGLGYGFIHTILSNISGLVFICVSLNIPSENKAGSLCSGLKLINPKHVTLRDSKVLANQGVISNVVDVLIVCMHMTSVWSNLVRVPLVCFLHVLTVLIRFYTIIRMMNICGSIRISRFLATLDTAHVIRIPKLQTVYVPRAYFVPGDDVVINAIRNRSLQRIYSRVFWVSNSPDFEEALKTYPRLREVVHFPLPGP
jgi:hypothetical protein